MFFRDRADTSERTVGNNSEDNETRSSACGLLRESCGWCVHTHGFDPSMGRERWSRSLRVRTMVRGTVLCVRTYIGEAKEDVESTRVY